MSGIQFQIKDGGEWRLSDPHMPGFDCATCCCRKPRPCEECGAPVHHDPVEGMTADGWQVVHAEFCENGPHPDDVEFDDYRAVP